MAATAAHGYLARRPRRAALWLLLVGAVIVVAGILVQAFSIVAYVRGAGTSALDVHTTNSLVVHAGEVALVIGGIWAWWGRWRVVSIAVAYLALSWVQPFLIGDTDRTGGWASGLHGLFALVLLVGAAAYATVAAGKLGLRRGTPASS